MSNLERFQGDLKLRAHQPWVETYASRGSNYPVALEIDPSNRCPLTCPECVWGRYIAGEKSELAPRVLLRIVEEAAELGIRSITWTGGGEPLVNRGTVPAVRRAHALGLKNGMFTSAVGLSPRVAGALAECLVWVRFHLDGADPVSYSRFHRVPGGVFDTVVRNIAHFAEVRQSLGPRTTAGIGTIAYRDNLEQAPRLARLAKERGLDYFQYKHDLLRLQDRDYLAWWDAAVLPLLRSLAAELEDERFALQYPDGTDFGPLDLSPACHVHHLHTAITADGRVSYCKRTRDRRDWSLGNVHERSLREIFDGERHQALRREVTPTTCGILPCPLKQANLALQRIVDGADVRELLGPEPATMADEDFL